MKEVYIIMSPSGGIELNMFTGKGKAYADKHTAENELIATNNWSKSKGYGTYSLVALEVNTSKDGEK